MRRGRSLEEKFWEKVDKRGPDECWLWTGATAPTTRRGRGGVMRPCGDAYGHMRVFRGDRWATEGAHRISYMLAHGVWPQPGMQVAHRCDVRRCANPAHLFLTDNVGNVADKMAKGRQPRGEKTTNALLTEAQVREIRALAGTITMREIGRRYGVHFGAVRDIIVRRNWKHVA